MLTNSQIDNERSQYQEHINNLKDKENMYYDKPNSFSPSIFHLAYQNRPDDREILENFAEIFL